MKVCTTCAAEYPDTERFCPRDGTPLRARDTTDLVGTVIAERYLVLEKLGEGGMGQVYLAEHVRMKRKSAVKVMRPSIASDPDSISRFNREAANACQIHHPHVAAIYDFGETSEGLVYLAMEYVSGSSLQAVLATHGALPPSRVADIVAQVADGLEAAHQLGIVHRDLKPDNVLLTQNADGSDRVKLVDFGISRSNDEGQTVTRTGQVVGTPAYMSPEQLSGEAVDRRSDIYTLAVVAYHLLTGRLPFSSENTQGAMLKRLFEPPRPLATVRPDVAWPLSVQRVLDRALTLDVAARFQTAPAFAAALTDAVRQAPIDTAANTVLADAPPPPTPRPSVPRAFVTPADLSLIETSLARAVGPIAKVLVRRAAASTDSREILIESLARDIDDAREREAFRRSLG